MHKLTILACVTSVFMAIPSLSGAQGGEEGSAAALAKQEKIIIERPYYCYRQQKFREYALTMLAQGTPKRGLQTLARLFHAEFDKGGNQFSSRRKQDMYIRAADAYQLLSLVAGQNKTVRWEEQCARWFFSSPGKMSEFLGTITPDDDVARSWEIIRQLYNHDPEGRSRYWRLILAMSVVWDQERPPLHYQMGGKDLAFTPQIKERYDYFKSIYAQGKAKLPYRELSTKALTYVVDTPVPVTELQWAFENVNGNASSWGQKFNEIQYDRQRVRRRRYQWRRGPYKLAALKRFGGICVEQGYYATITARAHGIPALFFVGQGRRGPHAWMGHMRRPGEWIVDVGRYENDRYATGHAVDPQTNRPLTDHKLKYLQMRSRYPAQYQKAAAFARLAVTLAGNGFAEATTEAAARSVAQFPIYDLPWMIQEAILREKNDIETLMQLLDNKAEAFGEYPDFVANIRRKQAEILVDAGLQNRARYFLQRHQSLVTKNRDDLKRFLATEQIRLAYAEGDYDAARRQFEKLLRAQQREGSKMLGVLEAYLEFTSVTGQETQGAQFLQGYIPNLAKRVKRPHERTIVHEFLARAYRNANMPEKAVRIERELR